MRDKNTKWVSHLKPGDIIKYCEKVYTVTRGPQKQSNWYGYDYVFHIERNGQSIVGRGPEFGCVYLASPLELLAYSLEMEEDYL